jgi:hypothetical protein
LLAEKENPAGFFNRYLYFNRKGKLQMAINSPMNNANTSTPTAQMQQPQPQFQAPPPAQSSGAKWSFHSDIFGKAPIGRGIGSETLTRLQTGMVEIFKNTNPNIEITLLSIDNTSELGLAYSNLIVCMRLKDALDLGVAFHTLIVEATGERIVPKFENVNQTQVEIFRVAGDASDAILFSKVNEKVRAAFPTSNLFAAGVCVVPRAFDTENKIAMHQLALNASMAVSTELTIRRKDFKDVNLVDSAHDSNLVVNMSFNRQQLENSVSEPVRSDLLLSFSSQQQQQNQQNQSLNSGDRTARIAEISAFIDLVWAPVGQQSGVFNPYAAPVQSVNQKYAARMVLTSVNSTFASTPSALLLALVTSLSVRDDNNWIQAFRPTQSTSKDIDMHDIGAVGIEANFENNPTGFGTRVNTKIDSFRPENLGQLIGATIQPGLIISLDAPECGPETWYTSLFSDASLGSKEAFEAIFAAANRLTNNAFGQYFPDNGQIFTDLGNRIHMGFYTDKNGVKRDIRDIDYLAVMNIIGERDPVAIRDWSDTFTRTQFPLSQRLAARKRTIMALTDQSADFTDFAQRLTFTQQFLDSLARGCKDVGLNIRVNTPMNSSDFNNERGVASFIGSAILQSGGSSVFSRDYGMPQAVSNGFFQQSGRYQR